MLFRSGGAEHGVDAVRLPGPEQRDEAAAAHVDEVLGEQGKVNAVSLRDVNNDETSQIRADGLFVAVGHDPNTSLFLDQLEHDVPGYLIVEPGSTRTNIPGVFRTVTIRSRVTTRSTSW